MAARSFDAAGYIRQHGVNKVTRLTVDGNRLAMPGQPKEYTDKGLATFGDSIGKEYVPGTTPAVVTDSGIGARTAFKLTGLQVAELIRGVAGLKPPKTTDTDPVAERVNGSIPAGTASK